LKVKQRLLTEGHLEKKKRKIEREEVTQGRRGTFQGLGGQKKQEM